MAVMIYDRLTTMVLLHYLTPAITVIAKSGLFATVTTIVLLLILIVHAKILPVVIHTPLTHLV